MTDEDLVLRVLDGETPDSEAGRRVGHDLDRIRRGMELVASAPARPARTPAASRRRVGLAAALVAAAATAGVLVLANRDDAAPQHLAQTPAPSASSSAAPSMGIPPPPQSLPQRVAAADRIVVGTVTALERRRLPGDGGQAYVLATVDVSESVMPAGRAEQVVALDYDLAGAPTTAGATAAWQVGDEVLLFLVSDAGTVTADVQPAHLQVAGGQSGRYLLRGGRLDAPFSLDEVRALAS